ncbi:MAG: single-stranded-DNA-specific exonuclease RecJ [Clostridia bacterium]|nr:single-stranded-DNA-specific exonuclease RecJ [Clostridia bacterium]
MLLDKEKAKEKRWIINSDDSAAAASDVEKIARELHLNTIVARILYNRGYKDTASAASFISMRSEMLGSPFDMADMDAAVARIERALSTGEQITVYGDYDVDGVTSVCTLYLYLKSRGGKVSYYIPNRSGEGYGVSSGAIDAIRESGTTLIITVDTGITANEEVEYAKGLGIDFIVTDHHECREELPHAVAVINPHRPDCKYPFKELAGVGVVFKLICAHYEVAEGVSRIDATRYIITTYADLVAIGTIADVMPIREENRIIVSYGLGMIERTSRYGLAALIEAAQGKNEPRRHDRSKRHVKKAKITSSFIGFTLAPRINAAGRVRSAALAVELFLSEDKERAREIAEQLCEANRERQAEENKIMQEAYDQIAELDIDRDPVIVLESDLWHHGVIGIVSSRITERFCRPSILISFDGNDAELPHAEHVGKGSGRSVKGMNLVDALCASRDYLVKFGGHELAAGLSVTRESLPLFKKRINEYAREALSGVDMTPTIDTDLEIKFSDVTLELAEALLRLEPYGVGNPVPMFVMRDVTVNEITGVSDRKHTRLTLGDGTRSVVAMYFSNSPDTLGIYNGDRVDLLFSIDINEWMDRRSVQLIVRDLKPSRAQRRDFADERSRFSEIRAGATFSAEENVIPEREDFVAVYNLIQSSVHTGVNTLSHREIISRVNKGSGARLGYIKLKFIIMVFLEMNIVGVSEEDETYTFKLHYSSGKKNLDKSSILKRLRQQLR